MPLNDADDSIEAFRFYDADGDLYATATYFTPGETPSWPFQSWVVDYHSDGQRLTGEPANREANDLLNADKLDQQPATDRVDSYALPVLDRIGYDPDSGTWNIRLPNGHRVWFAGVDDSGNDVVLYQTANRETRAAVLECPRFDAQALRGAMNQERRRISPPSE